LKGFNFELILEIYVKNLEDGLAFWILWFKKKKKKRKKKKNNV